MPTGVTAEWTDWQAALLRDGRKQIPRAIAELPEFAEFCSEVVAKGPRDRALKIVTALAENLHLEACRKQLGPIVALKIKGRGAKKPWLESALASVSPSRLSLPILELCILLARQLPTARAVGALIEEKHIAELHMQAYPEKAKTLDFYLHFPSSESRAGVLIAINELQDTAFGLGLSELALSPVDVLGDPMKLTILLERLDRKQFRKLADEVKIPAKVQSFLSRYHLRTLESAPSCAPSTGIYLSVDEYVFSLRRSLLDRMNAAVTEQAARLRYKLATGTFRYGAPAVFKTRRILPMVVGDVGRKMVLEVAIDDLDLSEQGKQVFAKLRPGDPVVLVNDKDTAIAWVEPVEPVDRVEGKKDRLLVRAPEFSADSIMVPWGYSQLIREYYDSLEPIDIPQWLVGPFLGLGYTPEPGSGDSAQSFVDANKLAVLVGQEPVVAPGRVLIVRDGDVREARRYKNAHGHTPVIYTGKSLVPRLCTLLNEVEQLAKEHGLQEFYRRTCPGAFYIGRRLGLMDTPLFEELEKLAPLEVLDPSQHEAYLVDYGADVVILGSQGSRAGSRAAGARNFQSIIVHNAGNMLDVDLLRLLTANKASLEKLVLCGYPVAATNIYTRLIDQGHHYWRSPAISGEIFAQTSDWYPGKTAAKRAAECGDLPGFPCTVQAITVKGHETVVQPPVVSNVGTAEYAILLYRYLLLNGYDGSDILVVADGEGQRRLIESQLVRLTPSEFFRTPQVTANPKPAGVIIASGTGSLLQRLVVYARRGAFLISPGPEDVPLEIVNGPVSSTAPKSETAKPVTQTVTTPVTKPVTMDMRQLAASVEELEGKHARARGSPTGSSVRKGTKSQRRKRS